MRTVIASILILLLIGSSALASNVTTFEDGSREDIIELKAPAFSDTVNITLPAECYVLKATMNVTNLLPGQGSSDYPEPVRVLLNDTVLWEFNATGYGALGRQDEFVNGTKEWLCVFGQSGGDNSIKIRLPKKAVVRNATVQVESTGPVVVEELVNFTGQGQSEEYGQSVSSAGDVNRDGYDDVIVGSPMNSALLTAGRAFLYFGGPRMGNLPNVTLTGQGPDDEFGYSVSDAGDVNNDSFPDVIVGAPGNDAGGSGAGRAYIFYGGANMDSTPDVILTGTAQADCFGYSVSGAGDLNGDGYDDVVVGAPFSNAGGRLAGKVHVFFGGKKMGTTANVTITGTFDYEEIGRSVSNAGDVNKDGYDDMIIGLNGNTYGTNTGAIHIYYGGASMDNIEDVNISGTAKRDDFGGQVSCAGDVNNDGYSDVIVGAMDNDSGGYNTGAAYVFYGGIKMNSTADVMLVGVAEADSFGISVSGAGDVNRDGFDDVVVGADHNDAAGQSTGQAYVYYGAATMDNVTDLKLTGMMMYDFFGTAVSGAGDVDNDGYDDLIVSAPDNDAGGYDAGTAYVYRCRPAIRDPTVSLGSIAIWSKQGYFNGTNISRDFGPELGELVRKTAPTGSDKYGNSYVDLSLQVTASSAGNIALNQLVIIYSFETTIPEFTDPLNQFISSHKAEKDAAGNITVQLRIVSKTPGKLELDDLSIFIDEAPRLLQPVPDVTLLEDSADSELLDLYQYFMDDNDQQGQLSFSLASATNASIVNVEIVGNRYISADALEGDINDNWTGEIEIVLEAADHRGLRTVSNPFRIIVTNVNDAPVITSQPPINGTGGQEYIYQPTATDGDNDPITFALTKYPENMTINATTGQIRWVPSKGGKYDVSLTASDGTLGSSQDFKISIPNRPPRVTNDYVPTAYVLEPYTLDVSAVDDDGDVLVFTLLSNINGMAIGSASGRLTWTPPWGGNFEVSMRISDEIDDIMYTFNITVVQGNRPPRITSTPITTTIAGLLYTYYTTATDIDGDKLIFAPVVIPAGMTFDNTTGRMVWIPAAAGNYTVKLKVLDGKGGEGTQEFILVVKNRVKAKIEFTTPQENIKVKGKLAVAGKITKGTLDVVIVQLRVDSGEWMNASGNLTWSYTLETAKLKNGVHILQARAYDGTDYSDYVNLTITVDNQKTASKGFIPMTDIWILVILFTVVTVATAFKRK